MPLSGLEIYKLLPKTNCKACGVPTCLAFAMKLATKGAELSACPYVTEESKQALAAASAPPIRLVTVSSDSRKVEVGNETVLYRHDKTFYHQPGIMLRVKDTDADASAKVEKAMGYQVERVGMMLGLDGVAVENASGDPAKFAATVESVAAKAKVPMVLMSNNPAAIEAGLAKLAGTKPLVYAATADNWEAMAAAAKKAGASLAVKSEDLSGLATLVEQVTKAGVDAIVLDPGTRKLGDSLVANTEIRRLALKKNFRLLGYPIISFPGEGASNEYEELVRAGQHIAKYAGIIVVDNFDPSLAFPLLTLRQNVYTDPQKPIQVKSDIYPIRDPGPNSPVLVTTNFSLTYFTVAGEIEASGVPTWLIICDSEGLSVLTAWAAGKFDAERIKKTINTVGIADKISHRRIVLPGLVAGMSGEVEDEMQGWQVLVGPREAVDIPGYLKTMRS